MNTVLLSGMVESINKASDIMRIRTATDSGRVLVRVEAGEGLDFSGFEYQDHVVVVGQVRSRFSAGSGELEEYTTVTAVKAKHYRGSDWLAALLRDAVGVK